MDSSEIREIILRVNGEDAKKKLDELNRRITEAAAGKRRLEEAHAHGETWSDKDRRALARYTKEIGSAEKALRRMNAGGEEVRRTLDNLSGRSVKELRRSLKSMTATLESGGVARNSCEWNTLTEAIRRTRQELTKVKTEQTAAMSMSDRFAEWGSKWVGITTTINTGVAALTGLKATARDAVQAYADMKETESQVTKYTGMTGDEVRALNEDFKRMDTRTSREQLNALAGDAGRLGIQSREEVLAFVEAADMINVALGEDLGEDAVKNIGKLAQLFGDDRDMGLKGAMLSTGSVINELAQSSSAAEGYIVDFTGRLAGAAAQAGMTQAQVMGLASVMDQSMINAEEGSTALSKIIQKIYREPAVMARAAGLDVKKFTQLVKTDANAALLEFAAAVSKMGGMDSIAPMLADLHITGAGVSKTLMALAQNTQKVTDTQRQAAQAFADGTSVQKEFNVQNNTVQAGLDKARKRFHESSVELGERLLPIFSSGIGLTSSFMKVLNVTIDYVMSHKVQLMQMTAVLALYTIGVGLSTLRQKEYTLAKVQAMVVERAHMVLVRGQLALSALWSAATLLLTGHVKRAAAAWRLFSATMKASPWGLALAAIAAVGLAIYNLCTRTRQLTDAEKQRAAAARDRQAIEQQANAAVADQIARIRLLDAVMRDNNRSMADRRAAAEELNRIIPEYNAQIDASTGKVKANTDALNKYIEALKQEAIVKATQDRLTDLASQELNNTQSLNRRKGAVKKRKDRISALRAEAPAGLIDYIAGGGGWVLQRGKNEVERRFGLTYGQFHGYYKKYQELTADLKEAEGWVNEQQEIVDGLKARSNELINTAKGMGAFNTATTTKKNKKEEENKNNGTGYTPVADDEDSKRKAEARRRAKVVEDRERREKTKAATQFAAGEIKTWEDYQARLLSIEEQSVEDRRKLWRKGDTELLDLDRELAEARQKSAEGRAAWSLKQIDTETEAEKRKEETRYLRGETTETEHQAALDRIALDGLRRRRDYLRKYSGKPEDIQTAEEALAAEETRQATERERTRLEAIKSLKEQYLKLNAEEQYRRELAALDALYPEALRKTEEYLRLRRALEEKYRGTDGNGGEIGAQRRGKAQDALTMARKAARGGHDDEDGDRRTQAGDGWGGAFAGVVQSVSALREAEQTYAKLRELREQDKISVEQYNDACAELDKGRFDRLQAVAQAAYAAVSAVMQSASQLMQANASLEEAKVTRRYDAEIKKAGENTARGKKLEEQKQKELAKIKSKYNKKAMAVEIAQALASTAMNALMAYGAVLQPHQPWTVPLAIAAAAAATAAGMMQVAAIKKQHEAQAAGYYEGGFTGGTDYHREAGVVHQGEFVANHAAVRNPSVLPVLRLIDHAQRTNTVASLTAEDVSRAVSAPQTVARAATTVAGAASASGPVRPEVRVEVVDTAQPRTAEAIERLAQRLEEGIESYVVLDGPDGLHRKYERYRRLLSRK